MFDFTGYWDVARCLVENNDEADIRSGISRFYYSGFGFVRIYLIYTMGEKSFINGKNIHKRICDRLIDSKDDTEASIGEKLVELKKLRNSADYDWNLDSGYFKEHIDNVMIKSEDIIQQVEALKRSPPYNL